MRFPVTFDSKYVAAFLVVTQNWSRGGQIEDKK